MIQKAKLYFYKNANVLKYGLLTGSPKKPAFWGVVLRLYFRGGTRFAGGAIEVQRIVVYSFVSFAPFAVPISPGYISFQSFWLIYLIIYNFGSAYCSPLAVAQCWCHGIVVYVVVLFPFPFSVPLPFQLILVNIL